MERKADCRLPPAHNITAPEAHRKHRIAKLVALVFISTVLVYFHQICGVPILVPNEDHVRQHQDSTSYQHYNNLFPSVQNLNKSSGPSTLQDLYCSHTDSVMHFATELNVTDEFHFLDSSPVQDARGAIVIKRGSATQRSDIEIKISISYASPSLPGVSYDYTSASTMQLTYTSSECVQVSVEICLRPDIGKGVRDFSISTNMLVLRITSELCWTVDNWSMHSAYGSTEFWAAWCLDPLHTHNVSATSITGEIWGWFVADAHLNLRSETGTIDVVLTPRAVNTLPISLQSIVVSTDSGRIDFKIQMEKPELWPMEPFTHTTQMRTKSGPIYGAVPLGTLTNYTSETGNIAAIMFPFGAASEDASKEINVESKQGNWVYVHVRNTIWESLKNGRFDPLLKLRSRHRSHNGTLIVRYASGWHGELEGLVSKGTLSFDGSRLGHVEKGENWVRATVGEGMSFMESWLDEGDLDIKLGIEGALSGSQD